MSKNHEPKLTLTVWAAPDGGFRSRLGPNEFVEIGTSVAQGNPYVVTYKEIPQGFFVRDIWTAFRTPRQNFPETEVNEERLATPEEQAALLDSITERVETYSDFQTRLKSDPQKWDQSWQAYRIYQAPSPEDFAKFVDSATSLARRLGNNLARQLSRNPDLLNGQTETFQHNLSSLYRIVITNLQQKGGVN